MTDIQYPNGTSPQDTPSDHTRQDIDIIAWRRYRTRFALSEPFVWLEVQRRLHERLDLLNIAPVHILDAAPRAGTGALALVKRYPKSLLVAHAASQFATMMLKGKYTGNLFQRLWRSFRGMPGSRIAWLPVVPAAQYDLIVCNLALTWVANPAEQLRFWSQQLAPGGVLLFSAFGPDTARTVRSAATQAGWTTPTAPDFVDMHDYGDMMVQAGLTTPVMDVERVQLTYSSVDTLRIDTAGVMANLHPQRLDGLAGKMRFKRFEASLNAMSPIPLELELVFGHAWKPLQTRPSKRDDSAVSQVSLDSLKATLPSQKT
jgi:malonyl-CoA O-methyltransferase